MDTADDAGRPTGVRDPGDETGWDARDVWRDRVRSARDGKSPPKVPPVGAATPGWDPLQTWRERVLKPRNR